MLLTHDANLRLFMLSTSGATCYLIYLLHFHAATSASSVRTTYMRYLLPTSGTCCQPRVLAANLGYLLPTSGTCCQPRAIHSAKLWCYVLPTSDSMCCQRTSDKIIKICFQGLLNLKKIPFSQYLWFCSVVQIMHGHSGFSPV